MKAESLRKDCSRRAAALFHLCAVAKTLAEMASEQNVIAPFVYAAPAALLASKASKTPKN